MLRRLGRPVDVDKHNLEMIPISIHQRIVVGELVIMNQVNS